MTFQDRKNRQLNNAKKLLEEMPPGATRVIFGRMVTKSTDGTRYTVIGHTALPLEEAVKAILS